MLVNVAIGDTLGKLTVLAGPFRFKWLCKCACGRQVCMHLRVGVTKHCRPCSKGNTTGLPCRVYQRLASKARTAIARCTDPAHPRYSDWGGRGIAVHLAWIADPLLFVRYLATLPGYNDPYLWLDRTDNDGDYVPGNLQFVTPVESASNRRAR
jgi:hypothetical protein